MKHKLLALGIACAAVVVMATGVNVFAASNSPAVTATDKTDQTTTSGNDFTSDIYTTTQPLQTGTVVMINPKNPTGVLAGTQDKLDKVFGIVVSSNQLPLQLKISNSQVYVATSGRHQALVTSENGAIKAGDLLAVSSLGGTLARAKQNQELVFGKALAGFDGKNNKLGEVTLKDTSGKPIKNIGIGSIPIVITIIKNPELKSTTVALPTFLQRVGTAIAEKPVSPARLYFSAIVVVLCVVVAIVILSSGIRSSIISIGRNPLSKRSIFRSLAQVILTAVIILTLGMFTVYLLLKL